MKKIFFLIFFLAFKKAFCQELFVYTEPASNMAAKSIGIRATNYFMKKTSTNTIIYYLNPELMWGVSKKIMMHTSAFFSNANNNSFGLNGGNVYLKYRFFSKDEVHNHLRLAAFGKYSWTNNNSINDYNIEFNNYNTGYQLGVVGTQLIYKVAISASASFLHAADNINQKYPFDDRLRNAVNYTLSVGKLILPKEYTSYKQTNLNCMVEFLGQSNLYNGYTNLDIAPSVQLIFNSKMRVDIGFRYPLITKLYREIKPGALLRMEYNFFNVYR